MLVIIIVVLIFVGICMLFLFSADGPGPTPYADSLGSFYGTRLAIKWLNYRLHSQRELS